jgi:tetratricopeptide (TPR) repeat protein
MKNPIRRIMILLAGFVMAASLSLMSSIGSAEIEIDMGDDDSVTEAPTPVPTAVPSVKKEQIQVTVDEEEVEVESSQAEETYEEASVPTPTPAVPRTQVIGTMKMKDYYDAGIKAYKAQDYPQAIRYLEKALTVNDPLTKDYYYAEANAMLGVIHQFYFTIPGSRNKAYQYYREALRIDPETATAKKYINKVRPR